MRLRNPLNRTRSHRPPPTPGSEDHEAASDRDAPDDAERGEIIDLNTPIIWLDQPKEDRTFDEKLRTFLDAEHGHQPARVWLLNGS